MKLKMTLAIVLAISMFSSLFLTSYAVSVDDAIEYEEVISLSDGNLYVFSGDNENIVVSVLNGSDMIEINFAFKSEPNTVYQYYTEKSEDMFLAEEVVNWDVIKDFCQINLSHAKQIIFTIEETVYEEPIDVTNMRGSVTADLKEDLADIHGNEYEKKRVHNAMYKGQVIIIYERMDFRIQKTRSFSWSTGEELMTLGAFLTEQMGLTTTAETLRAFSKIFGVAESVTSKISGSGTLEKYNCIATIGRYASVNYSEYAYTMTDEVYTYEGYDDADVNSSKRAAVVRESVEHYYTDSASYFKDYNAQVQDAYSQFLQVGQKN